LVLSPTLIEEEEEWIDAKDFKHILDLREDATRPTEKLEICALYVH
jgi:hypothetical protein